MARENHLLLLFIGLSVMVHAQIPVNEKKGSSFMYYYLEGEKLLEEKKYDEALANYNEALNLYPYHADAYYSRAGIREKRGDVEGALRDYTIYLELKPDQFDALFSRALLLLSFEKWESAKKDFEKLLELPPGETNQIYFQQDQVTSSINQVFTNQGANKAYLFNYLGLTELELNDAANAKLHFDSAIYYDQNEANYFVNLGKCEEKLGDKQSAIAAYQTALAITPGHPIADHNLNILKREVASPDEDERLLDEFIAKNPTAYFAYGERALYRFNAEDHKGAIADYNKAIELSGKEPEYWMNRGLAREKTGDLIGAYDDISKAIQLDDQYEKAWLNRANLLYKVGRYAEAIEDYDIALLQYGDYGIALYNRGLAKYRVGKKSEACYDLKRAIATGFEVPSNVINRICGVQ